MSIPAPTTTTATTAAAVDDNDDPSYIDYETFLDPAFSASSFANSLVLATNNPNDVPLDLSTPLSRVLFDIQEIDSHIDLLTTRSAVPLLAHTKAQTDASGRILAEVDTQITALNDSYKQLEKEVIQKHAEAEEVRQVAARLWETLRLGRAVGRCLQLGRQLEMQHSELSTAAPNTTAPRGLRGEKEDHRALVRATHTLLSLRELLSPTTTAATPSSEGYNLSRVTTIRTLRDTVIGPIERSVRETSERIIREFSMGSATATATFSQAEETRARTISALTTLYLLSPTSLAKGERWAPTLMLQALESYLRSALQSSVAGLTRALAALPSLERTLAEVEARCQNVVALEAVLEGLRVPAHPLLAPEKPGDKVAAAGAGAGVKRVGGEKAGNMLQPLLAYLETGSLASYFWRSMAGSLAGRVQEIVSKGGVSARTLRTRRLSVSEKIKASVVRGSQLPSSGAGVKGEATAGQWEREVAVMVGSVVNNIGR
ncbi:Golgi transport complex subunit 5-domain-containing protein [Cercophora scortea]|uniref:Conserved oligomeric Golgi complex subunit 5 n=1 Tax=Cercophora scortea TaxID=314031 RepID=A0AAE0I8A4_9PEZI|nr:Golgi transport complex subunit 5-domain-containing protein [Cercophora scortea]